ncbi:ryanodine receptor 2-like [Oncorhynchus tshawytscha]|uniref:ryanodine receptor 2-like n=2 Tax=Oncorhynchus tshawytscha TaxID=74940 RepID=UPI001C3CEA8A|nr:ryanodine receptor 2-like [Oncorhynchus tshawytscha]
MRARQHILGYSSATVSSIPGAAFCRLHTDTPFGSVGSLSRTATMADGGEAGEDEIQFLRTDDEVVLQCSATVHKEQQKLCLAAEGFGNRLCFLESTSNSKNVPPDLSICTFVLEQSLSVRALQEMLANTEEKAEGKFMMKTAQGGGHRTLLYGHAVLLRHSYSGMYLCCLGTSRSSTDKLAFDVGLQEDTTGRSLSLLLSQQP